MSSLNVALIGYGKMGQTIEPLLHQKGHRIPLIIDVDQSHSLSDLNESIDVCIEFTRPEAAVNNITTCIELGIPVVSGTTGWIESLEEVRSLCEQKGSAVFYASNYSIGVNLFFAVNRQLAKLMKGHSDYDVRIVETHHTHKLDAPSGTAITLAEGIIENLPQKTTWINSKAERPSELSIMSRRIEETPGTHTVKYKSVIDEIEITHTAFSRQGFALGAIAAAEWLVDKKGWFGMEDLLG